MPARICTHRRDEAPAYMHTGTIMPTGMIKLIRTYTRGIVPLRTYVRGHDSVSLCVHICVGMIAFVCAYIRRHDRVLVRIYSWA